MPVAARPFGRTGWRVSELGFGCGGLWARPWIDDEAAANLVHQAVELGVTVFDTGHSYGGGLAERRLGKALKEMSEVHDRLLISTKVGTVGRGRIKDFSPDTIKTQVAESLGRLGLEHLPLLFLHGPEPEHLTDDLFDTLAALKRNGNIGLLGINGADHQIEAGLGTGRFDVIMPFLNPVHRHSEPLIVRASAAGLGVMVAGPLARMAFAPQSGGWGSPASWWYAARRLRDRLLAGTMVEQAQHYRFLTEIEGWSAAQASLGFVLSNPDVHCAVFGTVKAEHLRANAAVSGWPLPDEVLQRIRATG